MRLPSLHLPVIALAGLLLGLGIYYLLALLDVIWAMVLMGIVLLLVFETALRASRALVYRMGARPDEEEAHLPRLRGRERYAAIGGLVAGLGCGYAVWGPVLIWQQGGGA